MSSATARDPRSGGWVSPPATRVTESGVANSGMVASASVTGLLVPSEAGGQIAVYPGRRLAAPNARSQRRLVLYLLSFLVVVAVPVAFAGMYFFVFAADQ